MAHGKKTTYFDTRNKLLLLVIYFGHPVSEDTFDMLLQSSGNTRWERLVKLTGTHKYFSSLNNLNWYSERLSLVFMFSTLLNIFLNQGTIQISYELQLYQGTTYYIDRNSMLNALTFLSQKMVSKSKENGNENKEYYKKSILFLALPSSNTYRN